MQPSAGNKPPDGGSGKTRLDREIEEILAKNDKVLPLRPPPQRAVRSHRSLPLSGDPRAMMPPRVRQVLEAALFQALLFAILAYMVRDISPLLATVASLAAVVCLIWPMVQRFRGQSGPDLPESRMWRGQVLELRPRSRTPIDSLRDWWESRRR